MPIPFMADEILHSTTRVTSMSKQIIFDIFRAKVNVIDQASNCKETNMTMNLNQRGCEWGSA